MDWFKLYFIAGAFFCCFIPNDAYSYATEETERSSIESGYGSFVPWKRAYILYIGTVFIGLVWPVFLYFAIYGYIKRNL